MRRAAWLLCIAVSCAPSRKVDLPPSGAVRASLLGFPAMRPIVVNGAPVERVGDRIAVTRESVGRWRAPQAAISVPKVASGALQLALADPTLAIEITAEGARTTEATIDGNTVVYPRAFASADLAFVLQRELVEELRLARTPEAATMRWTVRRATGIVETRVNGDHLEMVDRTGFVRFRTDPAFAVDVEGRRVAVTLEVAGSVGDRDEIVGVVADLQKLHYPIAIDPVWRVVPALPSPRTAHATVRLPSGAIMVLGGGGTDVESTAMVFDPSTEVWRAAPAMKTKRAFPGVAVTTTGKVVVIGGCTGWWYETASTEWYDETTNTWTTAPDAPSAHGIEGQTVAIAIAGGKVMIPGNQSVAEIFDPATNQWSSGPAHATGYKGGLPTLLANGKILVTGAECPGVSWPEATSCAEIFDLGTTKATVAANMSAPRFAHSAFLLPSGKVLVAGGTNRIFAWGGGTTAYSSTEIYDPTNNTWTPGTPMSARRFNFASAILPNGRWLVAGTDAVEPRSGSSSSAAEIFDPVQMAWRQLGPMREGHGRASMAALADGRALIAGGEVAYAASWNGQIRTSHAEMFMAACASNTDCASGFCVDGVCCNSGCPNACVACDIPAKIGTCSAVIGAVPHDGHPSCSGFICGPGATCFTSCTTSAQCANGAPCVSGKCVQRANGEKCAGDIECSSRQCWDGVCCNADCWYGCAACDLAGKVGTCDAVTGLPHADPRRTACGKDRECAKRCSGSVAWSCDLPAPTAGTSCGADACIDGVETHAGTCDGTETCGGAKKVCSPYACGTTACKTSCTSAADCAIGFSCAGNACVAADDAGVDAEVDSSTDTAALPDTELSDGIAIDTSASTSDTATVADTPRVDAKSSVAPDVEPQSLYGCGYGRRTDLPGAFLALALTVWARRRR